MFLDDLFDINNNGKYDIVDQIAIEDSTSGKSSDVDGSTDDGFPEDGFIAGKSSDVDGSIDDGFPGEDDFLNGHSKTMAMNMEDTYEVCPQCGAVLQRVKMNGAFYDICGKYPKCSYKKKVEE